jgi:ABC-type branched-subunit amino acid transport system substrate-binding protein
MVNVPFAVQAAAPSRAAHAGTIKIGFYGPLSGTSASAGQDMLNAAKLEVDAVNKSGGVLGEHITIDAQDSACNPQVAVQAAQKLVSDGVAAIVGPYCSGDAIPASAIFHRAGIADVDPAATNPKLTEQGFNDFFRTCGRDDEQGVFAAGIMVHKLHAHRVALIHDNTVYAKGLAQQTQVALQKYAGVKVVFFDAITPGSRDFTSILTKIRGLKPDVTYFTGYYADGGLLTKQFYQLGVSGQFMAGDSNNYPTYIKLAGQYATKVLITTPPIPQLLPSAKSYVKAYVAAYHAQPGAYSGYTYDAMLSVLHAIKVAKSASPSAIIHALGMTRNLPGATGPITFNAKGDRVQIQYTLVKVSKGQFVPAGM